jgi:hypothetical protein
MIYKTDLRIGNYLSLGSITSTSTTTSVGKVFELRDNVVVLKMNNSKLENLDYVNGTDRRLQGNFAV